MPMSVMKILTRPLTLVMKTRIEIQRVIDSGLIPKNKKIREWARAALAEQDTETELTIRIVDENEGRELNQRWRKSGGATNVLSFPFEIEGNLAPGLLGDIILCAPVIDHEARQQKKSVEAHWAHMIIHGILHLLGYDHTKTRDARTMEKKETSILEALGYPDPYTTR